MAAEPFHTLKEHLLRLGYQVSCFETAAEAADHLNRVIDQRTVGLGGSMTLEQMGLYERLSTHNQVYWHHRVPQGSTSDDLRHKAGAASVYLSSVNAISEKGEIVNIDGTCNRIASIVYGHEKVYLIIGKNKMAPDLEQAIDRARNVAAPLNARRLGVQTPCALRADRCYDCQSPQRICRGLSILWNKPLGGEYEIILVREALGY